MIEEDHVSVQIPKAIEGDLKVVYGVVHASNLAYCAGESKPGSAPRW